MTEAATDRPFEGQVAIVTGASRGVGRGMAIRLGELGAGVACVARATDAAQFKIWPSATGGSSTYHRRPASPTTHR